MIPYAMVFLQLAAGAVLLRVRAEERVAVRILGVLFLLNAVVTALMTLPWYGPIYLKSDPGWATKILRAFDAPTGPLLLAFLAARSARPWARRAVLPLLVAAGLLGVAELPFDFLNRYDTFLRSLPYYAALGGGAYVLAGGRPWERWVALAFLPRALYWGAAGILDLATNGLGNEPGVVVNRLALVALACAALAASLRLVRSGVEPHGSIAVPVLVIGPGAALIEAAIRTSLPPEAPFRFGSVLLLNLLTLALVRPVVVLHGVAPGALAPALKRSGAVALVAAAVAWFVAPLAFGGLELAAGVARTVEYGVGLLVGLLALFLVQARGGQEPAAPAVAAPPPPPAPADDRPQWMQVLEALRGSHRPPGAPGGGDPDLTQRAIVARTGIRASRVSAIVRELNEGASSRLDAYVPDWRQGGRPPAEPTLVQQMRGSIPGVPGVWLYYRLTPLGERLADAVSRKPVEAPPSATNRKDPSR